MPVDIEQLLSGALDQVRQDKERDSLEARFAALEARKPELKMSDLLAALEQASDEELDALSGTVLGSRAAAILDERNDDGTPDDPPPPKPPKKRTRPGRKSGNAYDWFLDDDGNIVKSDIARVYSGEDEPDEVELAIRQAETDDDAA